MKTIRTYAVCAVTALFLLLSVAEAFGQRTIVQSGRPSASDLVGTSDFEKFSKLPEGFDAAADTYEFVGNNLVIRGNAVIQSPGMQISADKVVVNVDSELYDIEAAGNVKFSILSTSVRTLTMDDYEALLDDPRARVTLLRYVVNDLGEQRAEVEVTVESSTIRAERAAGNLLTGVLQFSNFAMKSGLFYSSVGALDGIIDHFKEVIDLLKAVWRLLRGQSVHPEEGMESFVVFHIHRAEDMRPGVEHDPDSGRQMRLPESFDRFGVVGQTEFSVFREEVFFHVI